MPAEGQPPAFDPAGLFARGLSAGPSSRSGVWEPPVPAELQRLLPNYRIDGFIGRGGMGAVYRAFQPDLDRAIAIKVLPAGLADDEAFVVRFRQEARTLARLDHPGIVRIHEFGQTPEGHMYFVMEFVDGPDLHELVQGGSLDPDRAVHISSQLCEALDYAHRMGVIHRDVKPANILITRDGRAKLADFGLARPMEKDAARLTLSRVVMGTPDYMAPEQKLGEADHRADLYSLGVILYEMLCGGIPQGAWKLPSRRSGTDVRLDAVVVKSLQEKPDLRYQSAADLRTDLDRIRGAPLANRARGVLLGGIGVVALAGVAFAAWSSRRPGTPTPLPAGLPAASVEDPWINSLGLPFLPVPLSNSALLCATETRESDWSAFLAATDRRWTRFADPTVSGTIKPVAHPIAGVSWHDANAFCDWLTEKERAEGRLAAGLRYRLPTDREWSLAAGIQENTGGTPAELSGKLPNYAWGTAWPPPKDRYNLGDVGELPPDTDDQTLLPRLRATPVLHVDEYPETSEVTAFAPNEHGFHCLTGNVAEWVGDKWQPSHNEHGFRVLRGTGWFLPSKGGMPWLTRFLPDHMPGEAVNGLRPAAEILRLSHRQPAQPVEAWPHLGFRLALAMTGETLPDGILPPEPGTLVNTLGMHLLPVAGGEFHISRWETRVRDYQTFATETGRAWTKPRFPQGPDHPAVMVSRDDCEAFCAWLTHREHKSGAIAADVAYQLPSTREWFQALLPAAASEAATAEALRKRIHEGDRSENASDLTFSAAIGKKEFVYRYNDGHPWTAPVGSYLPLETGGHSFYDVGGNVIERQHHPQLFPDAGSSITWGENFQLTYGGEWSSPYRSYRSRPHAADEGIGFRVILGKQRPRKLLLDREEVLADARTFNGHTYAWVTAPATWTEAEAFARRIGGHLATVSGDAENGWLSSRAGRWFIGGRRAEGDRFEWITGEPFTHDAWAENEPDNNDPAGEPALILVASDGNKGEWNDYADRAGGVLGFIVEWDTEDPLSKAPPPPEAPVER